MSSSAMLVNPSLREFRAHYQALASVTRLRILQFLAGIPEITVQELADAIGVSQPRLSWHLRMLRRGQLVRAHRVGRTVLYSLNREGVNAFHRELSTLIAPRPRFGRCSMNGARCKKRWQKRTAVSRTVEPPEQRSSARTAGRDGRYGWRSWGWATAPRRWCRASSTTGTRSPGRPSRA